MTSAIEPARIARTRPWVPDRLLELRRAVLSYQLEESRAAALALRRALLEEPRNERPYAARSALIDLARRQVTLQTELRAIQQRSKPVR